MRLDAHRKERNRIETEDQYTLLFCSFTYPKTDAPSGRLASWEVFLPGVKTPGLRPHAPSGRTTLTCIARNPWEEASTPFKIHFLLVAKRGRFAYRTTMSSYSFQHLAETAEIVQKLQPETLENMVDLLADLRERGGRLFLLGVGGSAANASHAVNDFRKIAGIESYAPTDNVSELTARTNDEGWASVFLEWLKGSRLQSTDALMVFSVGGGNLEKNVSPNLVSALQYGKEVGASILGIVGRDGGYTAKVADACCIVPTVNVQNVTPHSEAFQAVIWHLLVSHPKLKMQQTKWEAVGPSPL